MIPNYPPGVTGSEPEIVGAAQCSASERVFGKIYSHLRCDQPAVRHGMCERHDEGAREQAEDDRFERMRNGDR